MSGSTAVQRRRILAAIRQITPAARPIQKFRQTKILPDYRCCRMKEYRIKEVQPVIYATLDSPSIYEQTNVSVCYKCPSGIIAKRPSRYSL